VGLKEPQKKAPPTVEPSLSTTRQNVRGNTPPEGASDLKRQRTEQQEKEIDQGSTSEINRQLQHHRVNPSMDLIQGKEPEKPPEKEQREAVLPTQKRQPVERLIKVMTAEVKTLTAKGIEGEIFCLEAMFPVRTKTTLDPDTMYLHQAMQEHDQKQFVAAMLEEVQDQSDNRNFSSLHKSTVPEGVKILPTVWQMKQKNVTLRHALSKSGQQGSILMVPEWKKEYITLRPTHQ
jgi:hypothetical protein